MSQRYTYLFDITPNLYADKDRVKRVLYVTVLDLSFMTHAFLFHAMQSKRLTKKEETKNMSHIKSE